MRRPSFQFYPGDWSSNPNLKRCTFAERGIWVEVMCLMHDQDEYGVLRWPLKEIAGAVGCKVSELQSLVRKGVIKGDDRTLMEPFIYVPRSGRKDGDPVTLIDTQEGPIWYSSRMVKDEYVRTIRGGEVVKGDTPKTTPKPPIGAAFGPRGSSSSSSPSDKTGVPESRSNSPGAVAPPAPGKTQIEPGFDPDEPNRRTALSLSLDVDAERERFVAHYTATGDWRANWQSQFRKWLLDSMQHAARASKRGNGSKPSPGQRTADAAQRWLESQPTEEHHDALGQA